MSGGAAQRARVMASALRLSPFEAEALRREAWDRYNRLPNADLRVGWARYQSEVAAINALEGDA